MRGDGGTIACPGCGEQHQSFYRLEGVPMLHCPALEPRAMQWCAVPNARASSASWIILVGAEPAPVSEQTEPEAKTSLRRRSA